MSYGPTIVGCTSDINSITTAESVSSSVPTDNDYVVLQSTSNGNTVCHRFLLGTFWGWVKQKIIDFEHPVGSIWISQDATSPAAKFGGTWEKIEGKFIMGASSAYPVGTTGGSATHTQTVAEMPSHNHSGSTGSAGSHSHTGSSGSAGGHSHSGSTAGAGGHNHTVSSASVTKYGITALIGEGSAEYGFQSNSSTPVTSWVGDHTHTFSTNSTGSHTHTVSIGDAGAHTHTVSIGSTGSGQAMSVLNPYYALYLWRRVA